MPKLKEGNLIRTSDSKRILYVDTYFLKNGYDSLIMDSITHIYEVVDDEIVLVWKRN